MKWKMIVMIMGFLLVAGIGPASADTNLWCYEDGTTSVSGLVGTPDLEGDLYLGEVLDISSVVNPHGNIVYNGPFAVPIYESGDTTFQGPISDVFVVRDDSPATLQFVSSGTDSGVPDMADVPDALLQLFPSVVADYGITVGDPLNEVALPGGGIGATFVLPLGDGSNLNVYFVSDVPEPSTLVLLGMGAISLLTYGWRKRK